MATDHISIHPDPGRPGHHHARMFQDHRWAVAGATAMYIGAALLFGVMAVSPESFDLVDKWWHDTMVAIESSPLTFFAHALDILGGSFVTAPLRILVAVWLFRKRRFAALATVLVAVGITEVAIGNFKALYDRARPLDSLVDTSGAAFPSGHATAAAVTAVVLVIVLITPGEHRRAWEVRAGLIALFMALSRTYLRAHWLTDVIAGAFLGAATALAVAAVVHVLRGRELGEPVPELAIDVGPP